LRLRRSTRADHILLAYNYYLGGKDNYLVDREAAAAVLRVLPEARDIARENRAFLQRAVRYLVRDAGIRQIIDIGTGIPTVGNVHEVAQQIDPGVRVAYVDNDRCKSGCAHALDRAGSTQGAG
jgi:S-adenosyl methyltransferase